MLQCKNESCKVYGVQFHGAKFCYKCGNEMAGTDNCANGHSISSADRFCQECGVVVNLPLVQEPRPPMFGDERSITNHDDEPENL